MNDDGVVLNLKAQSRPRQRLQPHLAFSCVCFDSKILDHLNHMQCDCTADGNNLFDLIEFETIAHLDIFVATSEGSSSAAANSGRRRWKESFLVCRRMLDMNIDVATIALNMN